ncbi:hypothetical protein KP79_PYT23398 [Mizuhopecten yessoensis]|uniref:Uncharacterized protein n=1 Tax=Mizuhopecten yessoensis TaxID=6573 RepID=A0A210PUG6_MIZYE|nr:hypothetical protein KP79_PYT23398 [Mizuhopecten yessoensis]
MQSKFVCLSSKQLGSYGDRCLGRHHWEEKTDRKERRQERNSSHTLHQVDSRVLRFSGSEEVLFDTERFSDYTGKSTESLTRSVEVVPRSYRRILKRDVWNRGHSSVCANVCRRHRKHN